MKFGEAIEALRNGYAIRRPGWKEDWMLSIGISLDFDWKSRHERYFSIDKTICVNDVLAEDWVICWELGQGFPVDNEGETSND